MAENATFPGFCLSAEVKDALRLSRPLVALESTIICHGMPFPQNRETAFEIESTVRNYGAVPATIAIIDGTIHVGLSSEQLNQLARMGKKAVKTSRRDIAFVASGHKAVWSNNCICHHVYCSQGRNTSLCYRRRRWCSQKWRINYGHLVRPNRARKDIHGTHMCWHKVCPGHSPDVGVSGALVEFFKSYLKNPCATTALSFHQETEGVTVVGYKTDEFPAFFSSRSGSKAPCRLETPESCAALIDWNSRLRLQSGVLIAVPIPDHHSVQSAPINAAIEAALDEAKNLKIGGKEVTPFLLQRISELTGGESLTANIALVKNNAKVGAEIAVALSLLGNSFRLSKL